MRRAGRSALLIEALAGDRPDEVPKAYADARERALESRRRIEACLARMPETAVRVATQ